MKYFEIVIFLILAAVNTVVYAEGSKCDDLSSELSKRWQRPVPCYCGKSLSNLEVTTPQRLYVEAVCGLRDASGRWIDLAKEHASLDHYDKDGNMPMGTIYLAGQIALTGTAGMVPSDSGTLSFSSKCDMPNEPAFLRNFCEFKLGSDADYNKLGGPKPSYERGMKCWWSLDISINFIDPIVSLDETDGAGTYARNITVIKKSEPVFGACYQ